MRYLFILMLVFLGYGSTQAQDTGSTYTSWNDFVAKIAGLLRKGTNRIIISEDLLITDKYTPRSFEAEASVNGYFIAVLYNSKFCTSPPTEYFNYSGDSHDYTFQGEHDGEYCMHLMKISTRPGQKGSVYVKATPGNCESRQVRLMVVQY